MLFLFSNELPVISSFVFFSREEIAPHGSKMSKTKSEDVLGVKWDRCLADTSIKMLGGQ